LKVADPGVWDVLLEVPVMRVPYSFVEKKSIFPLIEEGID
jgi:hypothetical protein